MASEKDSKGPLYWRAGIDTSGFDRGVDEIKDKISSLGSSVEQESSRIATMLESVPRVRIDVVDNASKSLRSIQDGFDHIDEVVAINKSAIKSLTEEYDRLSRVSIQGTGAEAEKETAELERQKQAIQENIRLRESVIDEAARTADQLAVIEQRLKAEEAALSSGGLTVVDRLKRIGDACALNEQEIESLEQEYKRLQEQMGRAYSAGSNSEVAAIQERLNSLRHEIAVRKDALTALREQSDELQKVADEQTREGNAAHGAAEKQTTLRTRLRELREELVMMEAEGKRGTEEYRALQEEAGRLTDAWGDATQQANILAHDQRGMQGIISGLNGVSGAYMAAQGVMTLFVGENEDLQRAMLKVQSLMSITMGLQQVQQSLDKDSAFRLVTLNGLKEWWNRLLEAGRGAQEAETAAVAANTAAQGANAAAASGNTAAKTASNAATEAGVAAQNADTVSKGANAAAAKAGTAANIGLAGAFRMVSAAIKSIPVFGWIVAAVAALAAGVAALTKKSREAKKELQEQQKLWEDSRKTYARAGEELNAYIDRLNRFKGSAEQEKALVDELNTKYGKQIGYSQSVAEWKDRLTQKGEAYCRMLLMQAQAQAVLNKYTETYAEIEELRATGGSKRKISKMTEELKKYGQVYRQAMQSLDDFRKNNDLYEHENASGGTSSSSAAVKEAFDAKAAARTQKETIRSYAQEVSDYIRSARREIDDAQIQAMSDGLEKDVATIRSNTQAQKDEWRQNLSSLADVTKQAYKDIYMAQEGATEEGWLSSKRGKMTTKDYEAELLKNEDVAKAYYARMRQITEEGELAVADKVQEYNDWVVENYGTAEQKKAAVIVKYQKIISELRKNGYEENAKMAQEQMDAELDKLDETYQKRYSRVFEDVKAISTTRIRQNLLIAQQLIKELKNPEDIAKTQEAIDGMLSALEQVQAIDFGATTDDVTQLLNTLMSQERMLESLREQYEALSDEQKKGALGKRLSSEIANILNRIDGTKERLKKSGWGAAINEMVSGLQKAAGYMQEIAEISGDGGLADAAGEMSSFAQNLEAAGEGAAKGGWIGAIVGGVSDMLNQTVEAFAHSKKVAAEQKQAMEDYRREVENLKRTLDEDVYDTVFGTTSMSKAVDAFELYRKNFEDYEEYVNKKLTSTQSEKQGLNWGVAIFSGFTAFWKNSRSNKFEESRKAIERGMTELQGMLVNVTHKTGWQKFWGAKDKYKTLFDLNPDLWGGSINGEFDTEKAKVFLETNKDLTEEQRKQIQNAIDIKEAYEEAYAEVEDVVKDFFGSMASEMTDPMWDALVNGGADAWEKWREIGSKTVQSMGKQILTEMISSAWVNKYKDQLIEAFGNGQYDQALLIMDQMLNDLPEIQQKSSELLQHYVEKAKELGYDLSSDDSERSASQGLGASFDQSSLDEWSGRLTAIQGHTNIIAEDSKTLADNSSAMLRCVMRIDANTDSIDARMGNVEKEVKEVRVTVADLATKGIKIRS